MFGLPKFERLFFHYRQCGDHFAMLAGAHLSLFDEMQSPSSLPNATWPTVVASCTSCCKGFNKVSFRSSEKTVR
jgi:hypothetical protein